MNFPNLIPVIVVTILNMFLGMLWYSPLLFGTLWAKAYKFDVKKLKATSLHYVGAMLVSLITAFMVGTLVEEFQILGALSGAVLGFCIWLGFIVTSHFSGVIWAQKPFRVFFIDVAYYLVSLLMMGSLLSTWL